MPLISAFRGVRYDLAQVGTLSDVVAPPYDVIDASLQSSLYERHPSNVVRLILNRDEPGDDTHANRYTRAARLYRNWQRQGVLFTEADPAIYVYHQVFSADGRERTRRGFMCRMRLEKFGEGDVHPHEQTHGGPKADRLKLWKACRANLSPIFGLYGDAQNTVQAHLEAAVAGEAPLEASDHLGVIHRLWPVSDLDVITAACADMAGREMYIADGHHRYETACTLRDELAAERSGMLPAEHPANFVLMNCVSMSDAGMLVLPTHRLFRGLPPIGSAELIERLGDCFTARVVGESVAAAADVWGEIELEEDQGCLALFTAQDNKWVQAEITKAGRQALARVAAGHSPDWQGLGVSILHRLVIDTLLDAANLPAPKYVHTIDELVEGLTRGDAAGRDATGQAGSGARFELAALVMPATLEHIRRISGHGERMPAKSTYFYPKLLSGLVINPLE